MVMESTEVSWFPSEETSQRGLHEKMKRPDTFHENTSCLMTGSLVHGL